MRNKVNFSKMWWVVRVGFGLMLCWLTLFAPGLAKRALAVDFTISGVVVDQSNAPIENIRVTVKRVKFGDFGNLLATDIVSDITSPTGQYFLNVPDAGPFHIEFTDTVIPHRYHREYFDDVVDFATSQEVTIPEGQSSTVANAQLTAIQPIMGNVTDESGNPLAGIRVSALQQVGDPALGPVFWLPMTSATTDATGAYTLAAPEPEPIRIEFADASSSPRYQTEYYDNATTAWQGVNIPFDKDHPAPVIDAQLAIGSVITGRVTDINGNPIARTTVLAGIPVADEVGQVLLQEGRDTTSDSNGYYTLTLPLSGTVGVGIFDQISPNRFGWQYYQNVKFLQQPTSVTVKIGEVTPNINFQVPFYGVISGKVTDKGGNPIRKISVSAHRLMTDTFGNEFWFRFTQIALSDAEGKYELPIETVEPVRLCFKMFIYPGESDFYMPKCYGSVTGDPATGSDLQVQSDQEVTGIDIQLGKYALVTGEVTDSNGEPLQGISVVALNVLQNTDGVIEQIDSPDQGDSTDSNGNYTFTVFSQGNIVLFASTYAQPQYASEYYEHQTDIQKATVMTSEFDSTQTVNFQLRRNGNISGTVSSQTGEPLEGVSVTAFHYYWDGTGGQSWIPFSSATTDAAGVYTITQVPVGTYRVGFGTGQDYIPEFYPHTTTVQSATDIVLGLGESAGNIDGTLAPLYRTISGRVSDPAGNPLANITVQVGHNEFGFWIPNGYETTTDATGSYTLTALPTGSFSVAFIDGSSQFVTEYYDNASSPKDAQSFAVPSGAPITNIDAQMGGKARIHGIVTGPDGEPIVDHSVILYDVAANEIAQTQTVTDGGYEILALGGDYRLCVGTATVATIYEAECYADANPADIAAATPITFAIGAEVEINLQLTKKANPNGLITILLSSMPQSIRNLHFTSTVDDFALDDPTVDDGDAYTNVISFEVPSAVYTFSLTLPSDRFLQSISCEGNGLSEGNGGDLRITLPATSSINCTYQVSTGATVRTFSYHDANGDGMFNEGETTQSGVPVTIYIAGNDVLTQTVSDENGTTEFGNLPPNNLFVVCQNPPTEWANTQPGTIDFQYNSPCYWNPLQAGQLGTIRFGNIEANDPDFTNTPSTAPDGYVIADVPLVNDTNEEGEVQMTVYLPLVSR